MGLGVFLESWKPPKTVLLLVSREDSKMMIFMFESIIWPCQSSLIHVVLVVLASLIHVAGMKSLEVLGLHDWQDFICLD